MKIQEVATKINKESANKNISHLSTRFVENIIAIWLNVNKIKR
jgi:hypothetical protein